jgi:RNA polymerase sigma-70 factor (ECF subfamily)
LSEIADCVPAYEDVEHAIDQMMLSELITKWLSGEKKINRQIFVRRYWYGSTYEELARHYRLSEKKLMDRLYHMRRRLKEYLEKEGISV